MQPFAILTAPALPIREANVDTDRILPSRFMQKRRKDGFGDYLFHDQRFDLEGNTHLGFILNHPAYRNARILIAGANFGCGSSREQAVYAIVDYGIRAVIAPSFGDIFQANALKNGLLPVSLRSEEVDTLFPLCELSPAADFTIDLVAQSVAHPAIAPMSFQIDAFHKQLLLSGLDDISHTLGFTADIDRFESARLLKNIWL